MSRLSKELNYIVCKFSTNFSDVTSFRDYKRSKVGE